MFRSIRAKFILGLLPIFFGSVGFLIYTSYTNSVKHFTELGKASLENAVNLAYMMCEEIHKHVENGDISLEEAQDRIRLALNGPLIPNPDKKTMGKRFRYYDFTKVKVKLGKDSYFFAIDSKGSVTMHPILWDPVKKKGANLYKHKFIREFIKTKNGIVHYKWKWKQWGEVQERDKFAVLRYFEPWDWIIGVAVYVDDFTQPAQDQLKQSLIFASIVSLLLILFLSMAVISITHPLKQLKKGVEQITPENLKPITGIHTKDEVGTLANAVNEMIKGLQEKQFIKETFGKYVSKQVQEAILSQQIPVEGEKKKVTLLFTDIRNFTPLAETMPPEELVKFLNDYFTNMVDAIISQEGIIDKFIGDAIMAVFGAPISKEDDTQRAIRAAESMMRKLDQFNKNRIAKGLDPINIGVGIHTGYVIAGNIGTEQRMEYTVVGDTVNLASRIESLTKKYQLPIILSDGTYKEVMDDPTIKVRELDSVRVKGRKKPVVLYEFYGHRSYEEISLIDQTLPDYMHGITLYKLKQFEEAITYFQKVIDQNPADKIAKMYIQRCQYYTENPVPDDWDGVFSYKNK